MMFWRKLRDRFRSTRHREAVAGEIHDELRFHHDRLTDELVRGGLTRDQALAEARRRIGNLPLTQDAGYDVRGGGWLEITVQDVKYGLRRFRRQPAFSAVAVLTLALGIGATTAIFSVANGLLLRALPYPNADRLAMVWMDNSRIGLREDWHSYPDYDDYRTRNTTFQDLAIFNSTSRTFAGSGEPERLQGAHGTPNLFTVLGVPPFRGRTFTDAENVPGANNVVVISHAFWVRRFAAKDDALESTMQLNGRAVRIIGVMPPGFDFPAKDTDFWVPTAPNENQRTSRGSLWLQSIGRLKPGVSVQQAQADLARINADNMARFPAQQGYGVYVVDYLAQMVGRVRTAVLVLLGAVACVLLIACTNVANLLLARASTREREMALRAAIGAGRRRLVRQLVTESVLLGCLGGVAGIALAWAGLKTLLAMAPEDLPRMASIRMDPGVLVFAAGLSVLTGLVFGTLPALQVAAGDLNRALREGGRGATGVGRTVRRALVVLEVALAVVLLVGAGLMIRSFEKLQNVDLGFNADRVMTARIALYGQRYSTPQARLDFFKQVLDGTRATPGIESAAAIGTVLLSATPNSTNFSIEGRPDFPPGERVEVPVDPVTDDYFTAMKVALLKGRVFDGRDTATAPQTVVINDTMARMFWSKEDPIGRRIKYGQLSDSSPWMTIVGVVADTRRTGFDSAVRPETYLPYAQSPAGSMMVVVRA
ncbi:MAG TPA: ABC transporter permease, partial [Vicinamibacterales bacterium]|nr:ABC transporter permease [Vicinamibacterales bacterium]